MGDNALFLQDGETSPANQAGDDPAALPEGMESQARAIREIAGRTLAEWCERSVRAVRRSDA